MGHFFVTGAAGFIGSNTCDLLIEKGHTVTGFDNLSTGSMDHLRQLISHKNFTFIKGSVIDKSQCIEASKECDYIIHLAAKVSVPESIEDPIGYNETNVTGTLNILEAARLNSIKGVVFASSSAVYGDSPELPKHENMSSEPKSPYALHKLIGEQYCSLYSSIFNIPTYSFRFFNVFGPRQFPDSQYAAVIPKFIDACNKNNPIKIFGTGEQTRDFVFVKDVSHWLMEAVLSGKLEPGQVYNVGSSTKHTVNDLAAIIKKMTKSDISIDYLPERKGDILHSYSSHSKLIKKLPISPVSLENGLEIILNS